MDQEYMQNALSKGVKKSMCILKWTNSICAQIFLYHSRAYSFHTNFQSSRQLLQRDSITFMCIYYEDSIKCKINKNINCAKHNIAYCHSTWYWTNSYNLRNFHCCACKWSWLRCSLHTLLHALLSMPMSCTAFTYLACIFQLRLRCTWFCNFVSCITLYANVLYYIYLLSLCASAQVILFCKCLCKCSVWSCTCGVLLSFLVMSHSSWSKNV